MRFKIISLAVLTAGLFSSVAAYAEDPLTALIAQGTPVIDLRARYETVDDKSKAFDGNAETLRARLGYETGNWNNLQLAFDFDQIWNLGSDNFNSTRNGRTAYPVIADPKHDGPQPSAADLYVRTTTPNSSSAANAFLSATSVSSAIPAGASTNRPTTFACRRSTIPSMA